MGNRANAQALRNEIQSKCEAKPNNFEERLIALEEQVLGLTHRVDALEGKKSEDKQVENPKASKK